MQIPSVDYSPLYRAASFKTAGKKSLLLDEAAALEKQGLDIQGRGLELQGKSLDLQQKSIDQQRDLLPLQIVGTGLNVASSILDAGMKIYGYVEQQKALEAKNAMMGEQAKIHQLADEIVRANKFYAEGEKITLSEELNYYVANRSKELQKEFGGFKSAQLMIDTTLKGIAESETLYAYNQIAQKTQQETLMLAEEGLNNAYQAAITSGDSTPITEYIDSLMLDGIISTKGSSLLKEQYADKFEVGARENILRQTVRDEGKEAAITILQNDPKFPSMSEAEIVSYMNGIENFDAATKLLDGKKIQDAIEAVKATGQGLDKQRSAVFDLYMDNQISKNSYDDSIAKLDYAMQTQTLESVVNTQGEKAGYAWSAATYDNDPVKKQAADQSVAAYAKKAESGYIDMVGKAWQERVEKGGENPILFESWAKSNVPTAYQEPILQAIKGKRAVKEHEDTMGKLNQPGVRGIEDEIQKLYDEVLADPLKRYKGIEQQRAADLDYLEREMERAGGSLSNTELSNIYANRLNKIVQTLKEGKMSPAEAWAQGNEILNAGLAVVSPSVSANFYSFMNELAPSRFMQASKRIDDLMKDVTSQYGKFKKWMDSNPVDGNAALKNLGESIQNMLNENPNMSDTEINQKTDKAVNAFISTVIDLNNRAMATGGNLTGKDFFLLQKEIDTGGLDLPTYTDTNERVVYPTGAETAMKKLEAFKLDQVQKITGKEATQTYEKEGDYDIKAQTIYTTKDGKETYTFRAGDKGLEMVKKGTTEYFQGQKVVVPDKVVAIEKNGVFETVENIYKKEQEEKRQTEIAPQVTELETKIDDLIRQKNIYDKQAGAKNKEKAKGFQDEIDKLNEQLKKLRAGG